MKSLLKFRHCVWFEGFPHCKSGTKPLQSGWTLNHRILNFAAILQLTHSTITILPRVRHETNLCTYPILARIRMKYRSVNLIPTKGTLKMEFSFFISAGRNCTFNPFTTPSHAQICRSDPFPKWHSWFHIT